MIDAEEEWRPVPDYEGRYEVSDQGNVRRVERTFMGPRGPQTLKQRLLKPQSTGRTGHLRVGLYKPRNGVKYQTLLFVHRLVLLAFVGPAPEGLICCHNDGDPKNNTLGNLRWDSYRENNLDTVRHGSNQQANKTHCDAGHPLTGDNLYTHGTHRFCRTCRRQAQRRYLERMGDVA